jgi:methylated-DNA-[protein]-cysteine S-methyltransferase
MGAIVESARVRVVQTRYEVPGWGAGELWIADGVVLAHELDFGFAADAGATRQGVVMNVRPARRGRVLHLGTQATSLDTRPAAASAGDAESASDAAAGLISRVRAHFAGDDVSFADVRLDLEWCTDFQRAVLTVLREVPRGEVVSYGELAALAGRPGAQRAVGSICARNRFSLFVPCHRVVAAEGLGGYGAAGAAVKRRLLALEGVSL